ncbi:MAG: DUF2249 domain-containing protein [Rhodocyclaceae bacterium]|jgi:uncharacterized protein (DUF2249 family)|nr:DUF2249 domain-containing protein [Rhodocyclaceae bacterium]
MSIPLDVRGLEPPQPFECIMEQLADLKAGQTLEVLLDRTPWPLFRILERDGHTHRHVVEQDGTVHVWIEGL